MQKKIYRVLAILLTLAVAGGEALAGKQSRRGKQAAKSRVAKEARQKGKAGRVQKSSRGRVAVKGRSVSRSRRGRYVARSRRGRRAVAILRDDAPAPTSRVSSSIPAERVTEIQAALKKAGYYEGEMTGEYDEATREAMKRYQTAKGLPPTGAPSAHTIKLLGLSKGSNDGYSVPVSAGKANDKKPDTQTP